MLSPLTIKRMPTSSFKKLWEKNSKEKNSDKGVTDTEIIRHFYCFKSEHRWFSYAIISVQQPLSFMVGSFYLFTNNECQANANRCARWLPVMRGILRCASQEGSLMTRDHNRIWRHNSDDVMSKMSVDFAAEISAQVEMEPSCTLTLYHFKGIL